MFGGGCRVKTTRWHLPCSITETWKPNPCQSDLYRWYGLRCWDSSKKQCLHDRPALWWRHPGRVATGRLCCTLPKPCRLACAYGRFFLDPKAAMCRSIMLWFFCWWAEVTKMRFRKHPISLCDGITTFRRLQSPVQIHRMDMLQNANARVEKTNLVIRFRPSGHCLWNCSGRSNVYATPISWT